MINKAVFLDRDGVINPLVYNPETSEYESPHHVSDFSVFPYFDKAMKLLADNGFYRIVVSNQPDFAKGKASMEDIDGIAEMLKTYSDERGGLIDEFCYCFHHPQGIVPEFACECRCRKPGTLFLENAVSKYDLDAAHCYFIGDRESDILCGQRMNIRTVRLVSFHSQSDGENRVKADAYVSNLYEAVNWIIKDQQISGG
jgi:D-glycero-D-manno-heptose 1,7-bisphosphate phosphatase